MANCVIFQLSYVSSVERGMKSMPISCFEHAHLLLRFAKSQKVSSHFCLHSQHRGHSCRHQGSIYSRAKPRLQYATFRRGQQGPHSSLACIGRAKSLKVGIRGRFMVSKLCYLRLCTIRTSPLFSTGVIQYCHTKYGVSAKYSEAWVTPKKMPNAFAKIARPLGQIVRERV